MPKSKLRVLVAENSNERCRFIVGLLQAEFELIGTVSNGEEIARVARSFQPNVIVSDASVIEASGIEVMTSLNWDHAAIPFVLVSADFHATGVSHCRGAVAYVDASDLVSDLNIAVRCAAFGLRFVSRSIPRSQP